MIKHWKRPQAPGTASASGPAETLRQVENEQKHPGQPGDGGRESSQAGRGLTNGGDWWLREVNPSRKYPLGGKQG